MLLWVLILIFRVLQVIHITCNMGSWDLPDMYALSPQAYGPWAYISSKSLLPMLQLILTSLLCSNSLIKIQFFL